MRIWILLLAVLLSGCTGLPDKVTPVKSFETERYLGTWYEIARLDHSFEKDLEQVTAEYQLREDGGIRVVNRGVDKRVVSIKKLKVKPTLLIMQMKLILKCRFLAPFIALMWCLS